jgi:hypothetical protein
MNPCVFRYLPVSQDIEQSERFMHKLARCGALSNHARSNKRNVPMLVQQFEFLLLGKVPVRRWEWIVRMRHALHNRVAFVAIIVIVRRQWWTHDNWQYLCVDSTHRQVRAARVDFTMLIWHTI